MKITIVAVGKLKEDYLKKAEKNFLNLISKRSEFKILEIPDEKIQENSSASVVESIKNKEGSALLRKIRPEQYVIALAINGRQLTTDGFKKVIADCADKDKNDLVFIIGGSLGLSDAVLQRADFKISFSPMTFPHQLMRIMLMEQLSQIL